MSTKVRIRFMFFSFLFQLEVIMSVGLAIFMCTLLTSSAYTLFPDCLKQCKDCSQFYGKMYDTAGCVIDCRESQGGDLDSNCSKRIDISKRVGAGAIRECQMFCVDCRKLYGRAYHGGKCYENCLQSKGQNMDYECTIYSVFG